MFLISGLLCELVQVLWEVHCECQDRNKCTRNLSGKTSMWEKMGCWEDRCQETLEASSDHNYSLTPQERGRKIWGESSSGTLQSRKVLARLLGSSWHKVSNQRRPMSPRNWSELVSLSCSVIGWEQFMGSMASVKMQRWFLGHSSWGPWSITLPVVESLQGIFSPPPHCDSQASPVLRNVCTLMTYFFKCKGRFINT